MEDSRLAALNLLLQNNFDAVSTMCVVTITKYVSNIVNNPVEPKYRTINTTNKAFVEKVLACQGAMELMGALGFRRNGGDNTLHASASAMFMSENLRVLEEALDRLNVPSGDRPKPPVPTEAASSKTTDPVPPPFDFDPYKTSIVRTAPQPSRGVSSTEAQLETLSQRRRELEGTLESVERATQLLVPREDGSVVSMQEFIDDGQQDCSSSGSSSSSMTEPSEAATIARSLANQIKNAGVEEPLTTKAVRDLRKAQRERVYARTLVRIKFPDRVCIQGYFHPRHTILDVYEWVRVCLRKDIAEACASSSNSCGGNGAKAVSIATRVRGGSTSVPQGSMDYLSSFELYTSPPKCVLHPYAPSSASTDEADGNRAFQQRQPSPPQYRTLAELKFVPAILMHCSLAITPAAEGAEDGSMPGPPYLSTTLRQQASCPMQAQAQPDANSSSYPQGAALVAAANSGPESSSVEGKSAGTGETAIAKPKPKWLKI